MHRLQVVYADLLSCGGDQSGVLAGRACLANMHQYPKIADRIVQALESDFNISGDPNEDRSQWMDFLKEVPENRYQKEKAKVIYFVGCVAAFFPLVQKFPRPSFKSWIRARWILPPWGRGVVLWFPSNPDGMPEKMQN